MTAEIYALVQNLYAHQTQALDRGDFKRYVETFTEDAVFFHSPDAPPARTRAGILAAAQAHAHAHKDDQVTKRHYYNQIALSPLSDGSVRATLYALVVRTRRGEKVPEIWPSCLLEDVLTIENDVVLTRSRHISYD
ncbi:nuclear transport factor 2 family protein [Streptomyces tsukubensis]|uniref:nuclear transport factor 2 family protein n=1 Tax=Streptomyces tsukubensis TaxID=83656 RepID=UPI001D045D35|nr:nuclear transport factor 2 family protein [Streptomyces tsukubensis]